MKGAITSVAVSDIQDSLQRGVDEIAEQAIAAYQLTHQREATESLNEPLLRWLDFTLRYIPPIPRRILMSKKFPTSLPADAETGLRRILDLLQAGGDVNPYQGRGLTERHDTSGVRKRERTDGLWADWNIHHLHLPEKAAAPGQPYSDRSDWLLFLAVFDHAALLIDVRRHKENNVFSLRELVETYIRTWPEAVEPFRLNRIVGIARERAPTDAEHARLRDAGVMSTLEVDGQVYFPLGMGLSSAVTAARVGDACDRIYHNTRRLAEEVGHPDSQFMVSVRELNVASPAFQWGFLPEGDLGIYETTSKRLWRLPRQDAEHSRDSLYRVLHDDLMPAWAGPSVARYWANHPPLHADPRSPPQHRRGAVFWPSEFP